MPDLNLESHLYRTRTTTLPESALRCFKWRHFLRWCQESKLIYHGANYKRKLGNHAEPILFPRPLPDVESKNETGIWEKDEHHQRKLAMLHVLSYKYSPRMLSGIEAEPVFRSSRIWIAWRMKLWARPSLFQGSLWMERKSKNKFILKQINKQTKK